MWFAISLMALSRMWLMNKSLVKNSIFNISYRGYNVVYPVITSAYISRIFLADGVGEIAFAINIVTYFTLAASLGIPNYAIKVLSPLINDKIALNRKFSELATFIFFSSMVATLLYYMVVMLLYGQTVSSVRFQMGVIMGLMVVTNIFNYDWLFESMEDFRYLAYRSITIKTIALLLMFLTVKTRDDILIYCLIYAGITAANNIWNFASARRYVCYSYRQLDIHCHLSPVFTLFAAAFATEVYTLLDSTMLGIMCPPENLGYYSNASRLVRASFGLVFASIAVFNPRLNYLYKSGNREDYNRLFQKFYDMGMYIAFPAAAALFVSAPWVMTILFGDDFIPGIVTLRLLSCLIIIFTLAMVFGHIGLIIYGKEKVLLLAAVVGAIINFSLNTLLIPAYQHQGAAMASIVSECLITLLLISVSLKCCRIQLLNKRLVVLAVSCLAICTGCVLI